MIFDMSTFDHFIVPSEKNSQPNVVGVYALPINADPSNTGDRLVALATAVGFPIIAIDYANQGRKTSCGMPTKEANAPRGAVFKAMSELRTDFTNERLVKFSGRLVIGIGDSLGVPTIQGVALDCNSPFDALVLRDGWNLGDPMSTVGEIAHYANYRVHDAMRNRRRPPFTIKPTDFSRQPQAWSNETNLAAKLWNVADLMRGSAPRDAAGALAMGHEVNGPNGPKVEKIPAMHIVTFGNGLSGSAVLGERFGDSLVRARKSSMPDGPPVIATFEPNAWHSDLLDPNRAARHVNALLRAMGLSAA